MITPRERDEPNQFITKNGLGHTSKTRNFKISVDVSLRHRYQVTSYHSYCRHNENGISDDKILGVSAGDGKFVYRSLAVSHSSSCNRGVYHSYDDRRDGYRSQDTRHSSYHNSLVFHSSDQNGDSGRG